MSTTSYDYSNVIGVGAPVFKKPHKRRKGPSHTPRKATMRAKKIKALAAALAAQEEAQEALPPVQQPVAEAQPAKRHGPYGIPYKFQNINPTGVVYRFPHPPETSLPLRWSEPLDGGLGKFENQVVAPESDTCLPQVASPVPDSSVPIDAGPEMIDDDAVEAQNMVTEGDDLVAKPVSRVPSSMGFEDLFLQVIPNPVDGVYTDNAPPLVQMSEDEFQAMIGDLKTQKDDLEDLPQAYREKSPSFDREDSLPMFDEYM